MRPGDLRGSDAERLTELPFGKRVLTRRAVALAGLCLALVSCSSLSGSGDAFIALESNKFTWRAAKGLGWGSRLAPVLASLEEVPGVIESRVDWTGRRFLLKIGSREDVDSVVSQADETLGGGARRLDREAESQATNSFLRGTETWMRAGETLQLSRAEARILAEQHAGEAARSAGLDEQQAQKLVGILESEIAGAFARIHADGKGLPANFGDVCGDALLRALERSRSFLSPDQLQKVKEYCEARSGR